jgi:arylsulfatase A-like enzyme
VISHVCRGGGSTRVVLAIVLAALLHTGCSSEQGPPNVLLISVDTLRPDRLGCYGHDRDTSPTIDRLAREGVRFDNAYSVAGWTLPAIATIMTGRYPRDHGATDFHWSMDPALPTMAGKLRRLGYDTRGYISHVILQPRYGLGEGFKSYDYSVLNVGHPHDVATAKPLTDIALDELGSIEPPFFMWIHYFDPHFEYLAHSPWQEWGNGELDRYDQEIAHTDAQINRLLEKLDDKKWLDNTVVIFTSDHGEEFGEHDARFHYTVYEEVMRVPLVIKAPGLEPRTIAEPVEQIDILPTLMALLQPNSGEAEAFPGRDVIGDAEERPVFFERDRPPPYNQRGVLVGTTKLFVIEEADTARIPITSRGTHVPITNVHPGTYMYDLASDPGEKNNIFSEDNPDCKRLLVMVAEHFSVANKPVHEVEIDETLRRKLRSLGYIR